MTNAKDVEKIGRVVKKSETPSGPCALLQAGRYFQEAGRDPDWHVVEPRLERVELFTGGRGWVNVGGSWTEVTAGALLWHIEGDQTTARSDWKNPYRCLSLHFGLSVRCRRRRVPQLTWWQDMEAVESFVGEVVRAHVDDRVDREALCAMAYGRLLFQARLWERFRDRGQFPAKMRRAMEILEGGRVPLREVAREVGWSVAHLHEMFQKTLGETPHEVSLRKRMQTARERLAATDQPIKRIAADCGFSGAPAFCHAFKARVGLTPLAYRRQQSLGQ